MVKYSWWSEVIYALSTKTYPEPQLAFTLLAILRLLKMPIKCCIEPESTSKMGYSKIITVMVGLPLLVTGCAPSDEEIREVQAHVVETFRHYDSMCSGLSTERKENGLDQHMIDIGVAPYEALQSEYDDCLLGDWFSNGRWSAPHKAWEELERYCSNIDNEELNQTCLLERMSQWDDRLPDYLYPTKESKEFYSCVGSFIADGMGGHIQGSYDWQSGICSFE